MLQDKSSYAQSGVDGREIESSLGGLLRYLTPTLQFNPNFPVCGGHGYYANIIDIGNGQGIAFCTDGVGTKMMVAEMMDKYDTIGIDCVAMNVNDIICVGARPISLVDYIACEFTDKKIFEDIGKGLAEGARQSEISISGGEISQIPEIIQGIDLIGSCIGKVDIARINTGKNVKSGNLIIGLQSNGIHSNGLTLARKVLLGETREKQKEKVNQYSEALGTTLGLELLKPTRIYVKEILEMLVSDIDLKLIVHITGGGFCNLNRVSASNIRFILDNLPEPHPVFDLIQKSGRISQSEMHEVFNMGIGMCLVVEGEKDVDRVKVIAQRYGTESKIIGYVENFKGKEVSIPKYDLIGQDGVFKVMK